MKGSEWKHNCTGRIVGGYGVKRIKWRYGLFRQSICARILVEREIQATAVQVTVNRMFWSAPILFFVHLFSVVGLLLREPSVVPREALWYRLVLTANSIELVLTSLVFLGAWLIRTKQPSLRIQMTYVYAVVAYVLSVGLVVSAMDQLVTASLAPLLICATLVGTLYYLPPQYSAKVFALSTLGFCFIFGYVLSQSENVVSSNLINGFAANMVGFTLSFVNWQHFYRSKVQEKTIAQQQEALEQMAYHDPLTQLPNRRLLDELVNKEVALVGRKEAESCLILFDIDNFKWVNDTYGHPVGDSLLREFAILLQDVIRGNNTLVRLGGEEFMILAPSTSLQQCTTLAERLRKTVEDHTFKLDQAEIKITASFGVATLQGTEGMRDYYTQADRALYIAKQNGKNQVAIMAA